MVHVQQKLLKSKVALNIKYCVELNMTQISQYEYFEILSLSGSDDLTQRLGCVTWTVQGGNKGNVHH